MTQSLTILALRDEALRKIGRNVVNFQKIEACLKYLVAVSDVQGTAGSLPERHKRRQATLRKQSLGDLAQTFHRTSSHDGAISEAPSDLSEIWIEFSVRIEEDPEAAKQRKKVLSALVSERNKLIHDDLAQFDHNSATSCREWIEKLDEQNHRILHQLTELKVLINALEAEIADLKSEMDSNDVRDPLKPGADDD